MVLASARSFSRSKSSFATRVAAGSLAFLISASTLSVTRDSIAMDKELSESPDFRVRVQAALRLGRLGGEGARGDLENGLRDTHPAVRAACAVALGALGDQDATSALERAMRTETFAGVKTSMKDSIEKLKRGAVATAAAAPASTGGTSGDAPNVERAKYVVQLGAMRNGTGQRSDLDSIMRSTARAKANGIKGAFVLDNPDGAILRRASERKIPVLLVDGNLSRLSQSTAQDGAVIISAQVDLSIRRIPQQTLRGMVSGNASASDNAHVADRGITELQNRAVNGAVESAIASVGSEIAALAR